MGTRLKLPKRNVSHIQSFLEGASFLFCGFSDWRRTFSTNELKIIFKNLFKFLKPRSLRQILISAHLGSNIKREFGLKISNITLKLCGNSVKSNTHEKLLLFHGTRCLGLAPSGLNFFCLIFFNILKVCLYQFNISSSSSKSHVTQKLKPSSSKWPVA